MFKENTRYKILTPTGFENFSGVLKKTCTRMYEFKLVDGTSIKCSEGHAFMTQRGFIRADHINYEDTLTGKSILSITYEDGFFDVYDPVQVNKHNTYYSNDIISHNTEFLGSSSTLISASKIQQLMLNIDYSPKKDGAMKYYEQPKEKSTYVIVVDVSEGLGQDYSAFSVIDVTKLPYKLVATFRDNEIKPILLPTQIISIARKYNDAFILIEINSIGLQVADMIHFDFAYENLIKIQLKGKQGQQWTPGYSKKIAYGVKTSSQTKQIGCTNLKALIESDKLIVNDELTIKEFTTFSVNKKSYAAEDGSHDDMVMTLVNFSWLMAQKFFRETVESDIRQVLQQEQFHIMDQDLVPFGLIDNGIDDPLQESKDKDGDFWIEDRTSKYPFDDFNWDWRTKL